MLLLLAALLCSSVCAKKNLPSATESAPGADLSAAIESDGVWYTAEVTESRPANNVRAFSVTENGRFRVLVATVPKGFNDAALNRVASCSSAEWRPMNSFTSDAAKGNVAPAAYSCLHSRDLADELLDAFNAEPSLARAMRLAFNVSKPCVHREGKTDPKLGGSWWSNHVLYKLHRRFRGTRTWTALLHEDTAPDAFHADGYEQLWRPPGADFFTVLRYPNDANWVDGSARRGFEPRPIVACNRSSPLK